MTSAHLKKIVFTFLLGGYFILTPHEIQSQNTFEEKTADRIEEAEEKETLIHKFEPNFLNAEEQRKKDIELVRAIIDTLNISDRKRRKLLKDLYKNGVSERLSKAWLVDTKFEDADDEEN